MSDLIRREDAARIAEDHNLDIWEYSTGNRSRIGHDPVAEAIRALPAVQPDAAAIREAALREAASYHELLAADEDALSAKYRGGSSPWFAHVQRAEWHREHASAILALKGSSHE